MLGAFDFRNSGGCDGGVIREIETFAGEGRGPQIKEDHSWPHSH